MSLEQVFSETDGAEVENSEIEQSESDETSEAEETGPDGETTEEESTVEDDATTTVAEQDEAETQDNKSWEFAAYQDEKQKRQELEKRLAELETKLTTPQKDKEDDTDYIPQSELKKRMESEVDRKVRQALFQDRLNRHYEETKGKYEDFAAKEAAFAELAKKDPSLREQFISSPNPAEFAYIQATNHEILSKYNGNLMAALDDVKKQQGIKEEPKKETVSKKSKTPSLANVTESEKNSAPVEKASTLDDLFEDWAL